MSKSKPAHISVRLGGRIRTSEQLIRNFIRKCKKERVLQIYKEKNYHKTKSQKKRDKKAAARIRARREQRKK